ncbi:M15 family metallopeptidase [Spirosoma aerolatum]|uniref:M15 family metallopeptidase n=1 Tax=Spirosoma aerolatum TaxID=1211326 RepID=UPI0009AED748|nr:M15 family metallopeptidase [Spirosoma aerolatum]
MINRDIKLCVPRLQQAWAHLLATWTLAYPNGPKIILVETYRSPAVQLAYYAQGRQQLASVNRLRANVGLPAISAAENKRRITNAKPGQSKHQVSPSKAFDIGFTLNGQMVWDEVNYNRAAQIVRAAFPDVIWGADWDGDGQTTDERLVDRPHFEV